MTTLFATNKISTTTFFLSIVLAALFICSNKLFAQANDSTILKVKSCTDFTVTGDGTNENWEKAKWLILPQRTSSGNVLTTKVKSLYSTTGIYFLFNCQDIKLSATLDADFKDLWNEDVVEVFLWTDEASPVYFEYEISPLNYELAILVSNNNGDFVSWQPFHYGGGRKTRHATTVTGGEKKSNSAISSWMAEFFIPYKLLTPLNNILPKPGTKWRANFYRIDYDNNKSSAWSWQLTRKNFHDYEKFGSLLFE
ncbi:MAG: carbohydrate-binding family 9-like protein [Chitinophagaceae bacterium]